MKTLNIVPLEPTKALKVQVYEALKEIIGQMNIYSNQDLLRLDERALGEQLGVSRPRFVRLYHGLSKKGWYRTSLAGVPS